MTPDPCDVCRTPDAMTPCLEAGLAGIGAVWIHRCAACGFRQVRPRLTTAQLRAFYGDTYFHPSSSRGFRDYARQRQRYERDAFFLAKELRSLATSGRLLEVGSALGFLLAALDRSTSWRVEGVEVSAFGVWYARDRFGVTVHEATLEDARFPPGVFDYVLQKDLLEHVREPRRHLEETHRIMRSGGRLRLITPNGLADLRPLQRARCAATHVPLLDQGHVSFFSRPHLLRLLEETGFRLRRFRNIGVRRGVRALGLWPGRRARPTTETRERLVSSPGGDDGAGGEGRAARAVQAARIDAEIAQRHRRVRSWPPYYYYRHLMKRLGALPPSLTVGQDFDVLVEKV